MQKLQFSASDISNDNKDVQMGANVNIFFEKITELKKNCESIYIYGTGLYGQNICKILNKAGISVNGFVTTDIPDRDILFGLPIYQALDVLPNNIGLVLGLNRHNTAVVSAFLKKNNFDMRRVIYGGEFIDKGGIRGGYDEDRKSVV